MPPPAQTSPQRQQGGEGWAAPSWSSAAKVAAAVLGTSAAVWAALKLQRWYAHHAVRRRMVAKYRRQLLPDAAQLQGLRADFQKQLDTGQREVIPATGLHMLMLPSFVTTLPTGLEYGDCYAIDLGGTNFRVLHVCLSDEPSKVEAVEMEEVAIPVEVYTGTGAQLFDFLATTLKAFIMGHRGSGKGTSAEAPVVGFCFSFPMEQTSLTQGILVDWTKGFRCTGVVGHDPVALLSQALDRVGMHCRIGALLNDTIGVWAAQRYLDPSTSIGAIIGTGTNACYVLPMSRLEAKWRPVEAERAAPGALTVVNVEWGAFESRWLPRVEEDWDVDRATAHPGKYLFEKLVSGMFLGEVSRRILLRLAADTKLLGDYSASADAARVLARLATPGSFTTVHMSAIVGEAMAPGGGEGMGRRAQGMLLPVTARVLQEALGAGPAEAPPSVRRVVLDVCVLVARRSATMVAVGLDGLLEHNGWKAATQGALLAAKQQPQGQQQPQEGQQGQGQQQGQQGQQGQQQGQQGQQGQGQQPKGTPHASPLATTIAVDGGVYAKFSGYPQMLDDAMRALLGPDLHPLVHVALAKDGSSLGAVVLAAAAVEGVGGAACGAAGAGAAVGKGLAAAEAPAGAEALSPLSPSAQPALLLAGAS